MGNENSQLSANDESKDKRSSKKVNKTYQEFFILHHKLYNISNVNDISLLDLRRIVFISIRGLYKSWTHCPSISLYNSIIIVPLKRKWILSPDEYYGEYSELLQDINFLTMVRWKDDQHLAIFLLDSDPYDKEHIQHNKNCTSSISSVWCRLSSLLQTLHDPMRSNKYNALIFSEDYWRTESSVCGAHDIKIVNGILEELYTVTMHFQAIRHILCESNPTLNVIVNYTPQQVTKRMNVAQVDRDDTNDSILNEDWWIADDYHEDENDVEAILQFEEYINRSS